MRKLLTGIKSSGDQAGSLTDPPWEPTQATPSLWHHTAHSMTHLLKHSNPMMTLDTDTRIIFHIFGAKNVSDVHFLFLDHPSGAQGSPLTDLALPGIELG